MISLVILYYDLIGCFILCYSPVNIQVGTNVKEEYLLIGPVEPMGNDQGSHEPPQTGSHDSQERSHDSQSEIGTRLLNDHVKMFCVLVPMLAILKELHVMNDDRSCLFAVCLLDGMISNHGKQLLV